MWARLFTLPACDTGNCGFCGLMSQQTDTVRVDQSLIVLGSSLAAPGIQDVPTLTPDADGLSMREIATHGVGKAAVDSSSVWTCPFWSANGMHKSPECADKKECEGGEVGQTDASKHWSAVIPHPIAEMPVLGMSKLETHSRVSSPQVSEHADRCGRVIVTDASAEVQASKTKEQANKDVFCLQDVHRPRLSLAAFNAEFSVSSDHEKQQEEAKVDFFLTSNGFGSVTSKRWRMLSFKTKYPLHVAVKRNDTEMVDLLLRFGADPAQRDGQGQTPQKLAQRIGRRGSHDKILARFALASSESGL